MELAVDGHALHDVRAVGLQPAVEVVQPQARETPGHGVEDPRGDAPGQRIAALRLPAGDEVESLLELCEQPRDLRRIVLKIAVDRDDDVALRLRETGLERGRLAEVAPEPNDANVVVCSMQARQRGERAVGRAVVDEDDLPRLVELLERRGKLVVEERDAALLVVYRDDHRDHAR